MLVWGGLASSVLAQNARLDFLGKSTERWLADLDAGNARLRRNAAFALGKMGSGADAAVVPLARLLQQDPSDSVRQEAAFALGAICHGGHALTDEVIASLRTALGRDRDPLVRRSAAYALGSIGSASPEAQRALEQALTDSSAAVRQNAAWALGRLGPTAVPALRKALQDSDPVVCRDAAASCGLVGKDAHAALPELLVCCTPDRDSELRKTALSVLVKLVGPEDRVAVQTLTRSLGDRDVEIRRNAALALSNIGGADAAAAVPVLLDALRAGDLDMKRQAAAAIRNVGKSARAALPALRDALNDPDEELRMNAAVAIGGIGDEAGPLVRDLVRHLADPQESRKVRIESAVALSRIGPVPDAVDAVPTLLKVLENPANDPRVRELVMWALRAHKENLRNLNVFPTMTRILSEPPISGAPMLRYDCAYILGMFLGSETPAKSLDVLVEWLKDNTTLIYTGTTVDTRGAGVEKANGGTRIEEKGFGDGRFMAITALERIADERSGRQRIRARRDLIEQLQVLADNPTDSDLRRKTRELLRKLKG